MARRPWFIVTGASRGLGAALTAELLDGGACVLALARNPAPPRRAGARLASYRLDLEDPGAIHAFGQWLQVRGIAVRGLVNNAGVCLDGGGSFRPEEARFDLLAPDALERTFRTNVFGPLQLVQAVHPAIVPGGLILNVTSALANPATLEAGWLAYRTSKAALNAMTQVLAKELAERPIKVIAVAPGWVRTAMGGAEAPVAPAEAAAWLHGVIRTTLAEGGPTGAFYDYGA